MRPCSNEPQLGLAVTGPGIRAILDLARQDSTTRRALQQSEEMHSVDCVEACVRCGVVSATVRLDDFRLLFDVVDHGKKAFGWNGFAYEVVGASL